MARSLVGPSAQYLTAPAGALVGLTYPCTLAAWVRNTTEPGTNRDLFAIQNSSDQMLSLMLDDLNRPLARQRNVPSGGTQTAVSTLALQTNIWSHAAAVFTAANSRSAFTNGGNKGTTTTGSITVPPIAQVQLGRSADTTTFTGAIAHAAIWNVALTDDEIAALGKGFLPTLIRPAALLAYWPLSGRRLPEPDAWRNRIDLTLTGSDARIEDPRTYRPTGPVTGVYVFVAPPPPQPFDNLAPADGAINVLEGTALTWAAAVGALTYDVYLGTTPTPPRVALDLTTTSYIPTLEEGTRYYWQIVAKNTGGETPGALWSFTTLGPPPPAPINPDPPDGATGVPATAILSWDPVPTAAYYRVYLGTVDPPPLVADHVLTPSYTPELATGARVYWRIEAVNAAGATSGALWSFWTAPGMLRPTGRRIEAQLGVGFRARLINESYNVGTWALSEVARQRAYDISGRDRPGTWVGSGFTSGIGFDVPEGCLGARFDGNGYVEIPDPVDPAWDVFNLSLAAGDMDLAILVREYVPDAPLRALIAKHAGTPATGNGYYLGLRNGAVEFSLVVAGAVVFRFTRGTIDAGEHLITAHYRTLDTQKEAFITIDGAVIDPIVTLPSSAPEPEITAPAPLRIGHFANGAAGDGLGIKAALAYASIGREGDDRLAPQLHQQRLWTDITPHVRATAPIEIRTGIAGVSPVDNVASTGTLHLVLDDGYRVPVGYYTPGHPAGRPGWGIGTPIRAVFEYGAVQYYEFLGRVATVAPLAGLHRARAADVLATDWIDIAAGTPISALTVQIDQRSDVVCAAVLDQAQGRSPAGIALQVGAGTWPFAVDAGESEHETILTELARVAASERAMIYIQGDQARGGRFVFEAHGGRVGAPVAATFDYTMQGVDVTYSLEALVNIVRVTYTPRTVDTTSSVLYTGALGELIAPKQVRTFEGGYLDPNNRAERVGGTEFAFLVKGTDIGFNAQPDGSGANLIGNLLIGEQIFGGNSFRINLENDHSDNPGYLYLNASTGFQIRGKAIKHYAPITIERRDRNSIRQRGPRLLEIDLPYESNGAVATAIAEYYLELYGVEQPIPSELTIIGNRTAPMLRAALGLQPGQKIALGEPLTGLEAGTSHFFIHEKRLTYTEPGLVVAAFTLAPAPQSLTIRRPLPEGAGRA